jgi:hypothetical protein
VGRSAMAQAEDASMGRAISYTEQCSEDAGAGVVAALPRQKVVGAKTSTWPTRRSLCLELDNTTPAPRHSLSPSHVSLTTAVFPPDYRYTQQSCHGDTIPEYD